MFTNLMGIFSAGDMRSAFLVDSTLSRILLVSACQCSARTGQIANICACGVTVQYANWIGGGLFFVFLFWAIWRKERERR